MNSNWPIPVGPGPHPVSGAPRSTVHSHIPIGQSYGQTLFENMSPSTDNSEYPSIASTLEEEWEL
jgi:hypothetical protein